MLQELVFSAIQCSPLNSNSWGPTDVVLIMRCSNYEFQSSVIQ